MLQAIAKVRDLYSPQKCWNLFKAEGYLAD